MKKNGLFLSFVIVLFTIFITYFFIQPVLAIQDDIFAEYMLGNGFSASHIHTTYFEFGFLFYEKLFSFLYHHFKTINWLTGYYILLHAISGTIIIYFFISGKKFVFTFISIAVYLFFFFIPFITKLSYTVAAGHVIAACLLIFIDAILKNEKPSNKILGFVFFLLIISVGLRVHIAFPLIIIVSPFFIWYENIAAKRFLFVFGDVTLVILIAIIIHQNEYETKIPNWENIHNVSDAVYKLNNYGYDTGKILSKSSNAQQVFFGAIKNNYLYDDTLLNASLLNSLQTFAGKKVIGNTKEIYWLLTDVKQFLLLFLTSILLLHFNLKNKKLRMMVLLSNGVAIIVSACLILFMKFPERIWIVIFALLFLVNFYPLFKLEWTELKRPFQYVFFLLIGAAFFIQSLRIIDIKNENETGIKKFILANQYLQQNKSRLFIEYNQSYPFDNFPALKLPSQFPFSNILFSFFLNTELRSNTLKRFNVVDVSQALCDSNNIIIIGKPNENLSSYLLKTQHKNASFEAFDTSIKCLDLYIVTLAQ